MGRIHVIVHRNAAISRAAGSQRTTDFYIPIEVGGSACNGFHPCVRCVPGVVCLRISTVSHPVKGAGRVLFRHILSATGYRGTGLCAGDFALQQIPIAPLNFQHRAGLLVHTRLRAFLQVGLYIYLLQLPPCLPLVAPSAVVQRVAYGVVGNPLPVVRRQFVLSVVTRQSPIIS